MISSTEKELIEMMVDFGVADDLIHVVCSNLSEKQQVKAISLLDLHFEKHKEITDEDILKILLLLTRP